MGPVNRWVPIIRVAVVLVQAECSPQQIVWLVRLSFCNLRFLWKEITSTSARHGNVHELQLAGCCFLARILRVEMVFYGRKGGEHGDDVLDNGLEGRDVVLVDGIHDRNAIENRPRSIAECDLEEPGAVGQCDLAGIFMDVVCDGEGRSPKVISQYEIEFS